MKFVKKPTGIKTTNKEGGESFKLPAIKKLTQIVPTLLMFEPKYYGDVTKVLNTTIDNVAKTDPEFILKLAGYTRNNMYLRTVSMYLLAKAASIPNCKPYVRKWAPTIIGRADELYEAISCHRSMFSERKNDKTRSDKKLKLPNSLKKGIADSFTKFDEYQFAKYNRKVDVTLKDVILLTHPSKPSKLIKKILDNKLKIPYTWETELSAKRNTQAVWEKLIDSGKLPYMAMIRNINNMDKAGIDNVHWTKVMDKISNPELVKKSRQLPFRFYSVIKNTTVSDPFKHRELQHALNKALNVSVENLTKLPGRTFAVADTSGSMRCGISGRSKMSPLEIASLMTAMTNKFSDNAISGVFGTSLKVIPSLSRDILKDTETIAQTNVGWSTNGYLTLKYLNDQHIDCDRVIIYTDEELYGGSISCELTKYKKINPNIKVYIVNLSGYGDSCVSPHNKNAITISGWSEKILEFISLHEKGGQSFVNMIEEYSPKY